MPITVERDPQRHWLVATATGIITIDDLLQLLRTARGGIELRMWPMLFDASASTTTMTDEDIRRAIEVVREATAATGSRGHVALVAGDPRFYALLLIYEIGCAEIGVRFIRAFRQRADAERWLDVMSAARNLA